MFTKKNRIKLFNSLERIEDMYRNIFDILSEASNESLSVRENEGKKKKLNPKHCTNKHKCYTLECTDGALCHYDKRI